MVRTSGVGMLLFLPVPLLALGIAAGISLSIFGFRKGNRRITGWGELVTGASLVASAVLLFVIIESTSSEVPSSQAVELITCVLLFFLGFLLAALGVSLLARESSREASAAQ